MTESVALNGYRIFPFENRRHFLRYLAEGNWHNILVALNAEKLMKKDSNLKELLDHHIGYADGFGAVLALRRKGRLVRRIPGAEFWLDIIKEYYKEKSFYLVGGKPGVIETTVQKLSNNFKGINIVNYRDGYMSDTEYANLIKDVRQKKPDVVFVAMGSPKQEYVMEAMYKNHKALYMGLGGSFDIYSEVKERAPQFFQKIGMEWFHRLMKEPSRIKRQVVFIPFLWKVLTNKL